MSKKRQPISANQLERRQTHKARRQRWDRLWTIIMLAFLVGFIGLYVAIQISHHV